MAKADAAEKPAASVKSVEFAEQGVIVVVPSVDGITTGSIGARKSPELVATARDGKTENVARGEKTVTMTASSGSYGAIIARYAAVYGVPVSLAHAVIRVESNYRPGARGSAGEVGLMQIKPATARGLGYSGSVKGLYNPDTNIRYGMKYLGMAHKLGGGSTCGTILKYNAGHGAKRMNPVSAAYCSKVKRHLGA
ncbi:MAG: transglycosylase SLT domain-containing protein [Mesorhizobium sp.]|nr:transglycosylase SLT domain-containing protein [Mesorhizobium sp.]